MCFSRLLCHMPRDGRYTKSFDASLRTIYVSIKKLKKKKWRSGNDNKFSFRRALNNQHFHLLPAKAKNVESLAGQCYFEKKFTPEFGRQLVDLMQVGQTTPIGVWFTRRYQELEVRCPLVPHLFLSLTPRFFFLKRSSPECHYHLIQKKIYTKTVILKLSKNNLNN